MGFEESLSSVITAAMLWAFPLVSGSIGLLYLARVQGRKRLRRALLFLVFAGLGFLLAAAFRASGAPAASTLARASRAVPELLLAVAVINTAAIFAFDLVLPRLRLNLPALVVDLILAVAYLIAGLSVLSDNGVNLTGIVATSAVVTAIIAFSLQETLGNVMGGMVLHIERSLQAGDNISVGDRAGTVKEIRWRQTTIETPSGQSVIIPNSVLMKGSVTVVGRRGGPARPLRRTIAFSVYYDKAPNVVMGTVERALCSDIPPHVAASPAPQCLLTDFGENAMGYQLRYWIADPAFEDSADSDVRSRLYYALAREGIKISNPARAVVVVQKDEDVAAKSRDHEQERRVAALKGVDIFSALSDEELALVANRLKKAPFSRGETLTRQGAAANWLYILESGEAEVRLASHDGQAHQEVARLRPGDFMGEMGLMTGEPRAATVVARTDVGCYRLDRESFEDILARRPAIAEGISLTLAKRRVELDAVRQGLDEETRKRLIKKEQTDLLSRIRSFFILS